MPWWLHLFVLLPPLLLLARRLFLARPALPSVPRAAILVSQTPAAQSPRALAHASALLASRAVSAVVLVAQPPPPQPCRHLHFIPLCPAPCAPPGRARWLALLRKLLHDAFTLALALRRAHEVPVNPVTLLVNVPPSLPALAVCTVHAALHGLPLTVDVHNLGSSLLRAPRPLLRLAAALEHALLRRAPVVWAVSRAMARYLRRVCALRAPVVYDRPRRAFRRAREAPLQTRMEALRRALHMGVPLGAPLALDPLGDLPPVLVTATSWTPDEDLWLLLTALRRLDDRERRLIVLITGKGLLRAAFEEAATAAKFRYVSVVTAWLPVDDYPLALAAATLGLSLHASSSDLDLPMKVVDMMGVALPVAALRFECVGELVVEGTTGVLFDDADGLASQVEHLLFREAGLAECSKMRLNIRELFDRPGMTWQATWERYALPTLRLAKVAR